MSSLPVTDLTRVHRHPERAHYDVATLHALLDQALICHVAFVLDGQECIGVSAQGPEFLRKSIAG